MKKALLICGIVVFFGLAFAMFYTPKYTKFNKADWNHKGFNHSYDRRDDMLTDLLMNVHLKGMHVNQLRKLFGPDEVEVIEKNDTLRITFNILNEIRPGALYTKDLILYLDQDSVVNSMKLKEQRKK